MGGVELRLLQGALREAWLLRPGLSPGAAGPSRVSSSGVKPCSRAVKNAKRKAATEAIVMCGRELDGVGSRGAGELDGVGSRGAGELDRVGAEARRRVRATIASGAPCWRSFESSRKIRIGWKTGASSV